MSSLTVWPQFPLLPGAQKLPVREGRRRSESYHCLASVSPSVPEKQLRGRGVERETPGGSLALAEKSGEQWKQGGKVIWGGGLLALVPAGLGRCRFLERVGSQGPGGSSAFPTACWGNVPRGYLEDLGSWGPVAATSPAVDSLERLERGKGQTRPLRESVHL